MQIHLNTKYNKGVLQTEWKKEEINAGKTNEEWSTFTIRSPVASMRSNNREVSRQKYCTQRL